MTRPVPPARAAVEAVWRIESARLVAGLARLVGDVGQAEELAQDALVAALEQWPVEGVPANPGGWLMSTAKHRAVDQLRRRQNYQRKLAEVGRMSEQQAPDEPDYIEDDLLRLVFVCCHPVLRTEGRVALALRLLGGLSTAEIARAFLVPEPTVGQRIWRAKRTLADRQVPFELPGPAELPGRLASVLEVVYLIFNEGYAASAGADWTRPELCADALRLGRLVTGLLPDQPEAHGLVALLELQASRLPARTGPDGAPVLLPDQDRRRWDKLLIRRGLAALARAQARGGDFGPYALQAAIAATHARAVTAGETDWARIAALYRVLVEVSPSSVAELNRAIAVGMASGPAAGLAVADAVRDAPGLARYPHLPAVRGDLLARLGREDEARAEFARAAELTGNARERALFQARAAEPHGTG